MSKRVEGRFSGICSHLEEYVCVSFRYTLTWEERALTLTFTGKGTLAVNMTLTDY